MSSTSGSANGLGLAREKFNRSLRVTTPMSVPFSTTGSRRIPYIANTVTAEEMESSGCTTYTPRLMYSDTGVQARFLVEEDVHQAGLGNEADDFAVRGYDRRAAEMLCAEDSHGIGQRGLGANRDDAVAHDIANDGHQGSPFGVGQ